MAKRGLPRAGRAMWSIAKVAAYLQVSREKVLILEIRDEDFPRHAIVRDTPHWDEDQIVAWAEAVDWFDDDDEED